MGNIMKYIQYNKIGHTAFVVLNRPLSLNSINEQMNRELEEVCHTIQIDREVYVAVITGVGNKAFCVGSELQSSWKPYEATIAIASIDCPVIAAINGDTFGLGMEIALSCDLRIASAEARFSLPQIIRGEFPSNGATQRLSRIVGKSQALELLLTGRVLDAKEALFMGLVNKVFPAEELNGEIGKLTQGIESKAPIASKFIKEAVYKGIDLTLEQGLRLEADLYFLLHTTFDRTEGINAFRGKRMPEFRGE
ncbi:enoyl-CoA hydratase/isomerase family protein [Chloroflexota bacterium]